VAHTTPPAGPVVAGPRLLVAEGRGSGGGRGGGQRERISSLDFIALSGGREPGEWSEDVARGPTRVPTPAW